MLVVQSLSSLLKNMKEDTLLSSFKNFSTKKDEDISSFLQNLAIEYEKTDIARTFIIFSDDYKGRVLGYFTIGLNVLKFDKYMNIEEAYDGINLYEQDYHPIYKLFMVGKDDNCPVNFSIKEEIFEREVIDLIREAKEKVGTNLIYLDCVKELLNYYESLGFERFSYNDQSKLYCMIRTI